MKDGRARELVKFTIIEVVGVLGFVTDPVGNGLAAR